MLKAIVDGAILSKVIVQSIVVRLAHRNRMKIGKTWTNNRMIQQRFSVDDVN